MTDGAIDKQRRKGNAKIVSFSGIDGAGKSTQIDHLRLSCQEIGLRVQSVIFWEDIAKLKSVRETAGYAIFKGDKGVGSPSAPINRRDKNVQSFPMTVVRLFIYFIDALSTRNAFKKARRIDADLVIFDRYIYDELANLSLSKPILRIYARLILKLTPKPDVSYILDADPAQARARKPEYPLDFLVQNRNAYLRLSKIAGGLTVVPPLTIDKVKDVVVECASRLFGVAPALDAFSIAKLPKAQTQSVRMEPL
jgi:thymidylate kinase